MSGRDQIDGVRDVECEMRDNSNDDGEGEGRRGGGGRPACGRNTEEVGECL